MRRIVPFFALLALVAAAAPAAGQGTMRMSTVVDNMVGEAGDTPEARLLFSRDDEEELCVIIAIPTGPTALRAPLFRFALRVEGADRSEPLKFPLPKKPEQPTDDKRLRVWEGCLPVAVDTGEAGAVIDVTYHDPRLLEERAEHAVLWPTAESPQGVDVLKDSAGNLLFQEFRPEPDQPL